MIFLSDAQGTITGSFPTPTYQGSTKANEIVLVAPFDVGAVINAVFELPNKARVFPQIMSEGQEYPYTMTVDPNFNIPYSDGLKLNVWRLSVDLPITQFSGNLSVQFLVDTPTQRLTTSKATFPIVEGVGYLPIVIPDGDAEQILQYVSLALQAKNKAVASALKSEGYAVGTQDDVPVVEGSVYYENNAKFYAQKAIRESTFDFVITKPEQLTTEFLASLSPEFATILVKNVEAYIPRIDVPENIRYIEFVGCKINAALDGGFHVDSRFKHNYVIAGLNATNRNYYANTLVKVDGFDLVLRCNGILAYNCYNISHCEIIHASNCQIINNCEIVADEGIPFDPQTSTAICLQNCKNITNVACDVNPNSNFGNVGLQYCENISNVSKFNQNIGVKYITCKFVNVDTCVDYIEQNTADGKIKVIKQDGSFEALPKDVNPVASTVAVRDEKGSVKVANAVNDADAVPKKQMEDAIRESATVIYDFKGSVNTYQDLPTEGNQVGDVYDTLQDSTVDGKFYPAGTNFRWTTINGVDRWDALGGNIASVIARLNELDSEKYGRIFQKVNGDITQADATEILNNYSFFEGQIIEFITNETVNATIAYGWVMGNGDGDKYLITIDKDGIIVQWSKAFSEVVNVRQRETSVQATPNSVLRRDGDGKAMVTWQGIPSPAVNEAWLSPTPPPSERREIFVPSYQNGALQGRNKNFASAPAETLVNKATFGDLQSRVDYLEGITTSLVCDDSSVYAKPIPADVYPKAMLNSIGGNTRKTTNLIPFPYEFMPSGSGEITQGGITITVNADGTIMLNGTSNSRIIVRLLTNASFNIATQNYYLSGCPQNRAESTEYFLGVVVKNESGAQYPNDKGTGYNFKEHYQEGIISEINIQVYPNVTVNNLVFKPMLNEGSTALPYEPYFEGLKPTKTTAIQPVGANLFDYENAEILSAHTSIVERIKNGYKIKKKIEHSSCYAEIGLGILHPGHYNFRCNVSNDTAKILLFKGHEYQNYLYLNKSWNTITIKEMAVYSAYLYPIDADELGETNFTDFMLNIGSTPLPYTPYKSFPPIPIPQEVQAIKNYGNSWTYHDFKTHHDKYNGYVLNGTEQINNSSRNITIKVADNQTVKNPKVGVSYPYPYIWDYDREGVFLTNEAGHTTIYIGTKLSEKFGIDAETFRAELKRLYDAGTPFTVANEGLVDTQTPVSQYFADTTLPDLEVEAGGSIIFENEDKAPVPSKLCYLRPKSGITPTGGETV